MILFQIQNKHVLERFIKNYPYRIERKFPIHGFIQFHVSYIIFYLVLTVKIVIWAALSFYIFLDNISPIKINTANTIAPITAAVNSVELLTKYWVNKLAIKYTPTSNRHFLKLIFS